MSESYDVGTRAWQPDATEGWVASEVVKKTIDGNKVTLVFELENGEVSSPVDCARDRRGLLLSGFGIRMIDMFPLTDQNA